MKLMRRRSAPSAEMQLLDHLGELRKRLIWIVLGVGAGAVVGWIMYPQILVILKAPACPYLEDCKLIVTGPLEPFHLRLKIAASAGFALAFPVVLYNVWRFVSPGLKSSERKWAIPFIGGGMLLFAVGIGFGYYSIPASLEFLIGPSITGPDVEPLLRAGEFIGFIQTYLLVCGLMFQFPVVLVALSLARILPSARMRKYRRHVFIAIAIVIALATPSVDPWTMGVFTGAAYLLYEISILIAWLLKR